MYKAVVHLNDSDADKQAVVLRNVRNLSADLGTDAQIELVIHGPSITLTVPGHAHQQALSELLASGVAVAACRNSLRSQELAEADLLAGVTAVSSGVGHLVRRQHDGWAYLRP